MIIDTDMGFDVDDVGAVCVAQALQDNGETEILLVVHDTGFRLGAGAISSINHYYGRDDIWLGAYKGEFGKNYGSQNKYAEDIIRDHPGPIKNFDNIWDAAYAYRRVLAA